MRKSIELRPDFVWTQGLLAGLAALFGLGLLLYALYVGVGSLLKVSAEGRIWKDGIVAENAEVSTNRSPGKNFVSYRFEIFFDDEAGDPHEAALDVQVLRLFGDLSTDEEPVVKYLPGQPNRVALSWLVDGKVTRIGFSLVIAGGAGVGAFLLLWQAWSSFRRLDAAAAISKKAVAVVADYQGYEEELNDKGRPTGNISYSYYVPTIEGLHFSVVGKRSETIKRKKGGPMFLDEGCTKVLVLVSPRYPKQPVLVRQDAYPFRFAPDFFSTIGL